jgi:hypothetical protein
MSDKFAGWRKSTHSGDGNSCVEVAAAQPQPDHGHVTAAIGVRDSKRNGRGPVLEFSAGAWREFLSRINHA